MFVLVFVAVIGARPSLHPMANGGTPGGIPVETDCAIRQFVWEAGKCEVKCLQTTQTNSKYASKLHHRAHTTGASQPLCAPPPSHTHTTLDFNDPTLLTLCCY